MAEPTTSTVPRLWRIEEAVDPRARNRAKRRRAIFALQAAIMALTGAIVGMLYWISPAPRPRLVALWVSRHPSGRLPPPPQAPRDLAALSALWSGAGFGAADKPSPALDRDGFVNALNGLRTRGARGATLVVYVRANATVRPPSPEADARPRVAAATTSATTRARVYLLPADADPAQPVTWIPLRDVLEALAKTAGNRLLVLDLNPTTVPRAGALDDDVAAALPDELKEVDDPGRLVLTSCGPGEKPLASEDLGGSAFLHYLIEGFGGKADGFRGNPDGAVSAAELSAFVAARVDRWAGLNLGARQRPALLGTGRKDAPLIVLAGGLPAPAAATPKVSTGAVLKSAASGTAAPAAAELKESTVAALKSAVVGAGPAAEKPPAYPEWLAHAWAERDQWRKDGRSRAIPWAFRALEARALQAEADWRAGSDPGAVEAHLKAEAAALRATWTAALEPPKADAIRSLALERSLGRLPDAEVVRLAAAVAGLRREMTEGFKTGKPEEAERARKERLQKFLVDEKATAANVPLFARAVVKAAADGTPTPTPESLAALEQVLRASVLLAGPDAEPPIEALALRRLNARAADWNGEPGKPDWPTDAAHLALTLADRAAEAEGRPRAAPWVGRELSEAARGRHDAEVLLWERGYARDAEARGLLANAAGRFESVAADARAVESALDTLERALELLPAAAPLLDAIPPLDEPWLAAAGHAAELASTLSPATGPPPPARLLPAVEVLAPALEAELKLIRDTVAGQVARLAAPAGTPDVTGSAPLSPGAEVLAIDALLASTLPPADDRQALWLAARARARPLLDASKALDLAPDEAGTGDDAPANDSEPEADADPEAVVPTRGIGPRARRSAALLAMAGLDPAAVKALDADARAAAEPADRETSANVLARLPDAILGHWKELHGSLGGADRRGSDRVSRVLPALEPSPVLDEPGRNPSLRLRALAWDEVWRRTADRLDVDASDLSGEPKLADTAARLRTLGAGELARVGLPPREAPGTAHRPLSPFLGGPPEPGELSRERPSAEVVVRLRKPDAGQTLVVGPVGLDERWLRVSPSPEPPSGTSEVSTRRSFRVGLGPAPAGASGAPPGFLLRAGTSGEGWDFHARVPVGVSLDATVPQVLVSADPERPVAPLGEIRLRPVPGIQHDFVYVRNPSDRPRKLTVELLAADKTVPGSPWTLSLARGDVRRVDFPPPPPTPAPPGVVVPPPPAPASPGAEPELPELSGPLVFRLRDEATGQVVFTRRLPVTVASPLEYVRATGAAFSPPGPATKGRNRLSVTLQAAPGFAGPPCPAKLVVTPDRVPGLKGVNDETGQGVLKKAGDALTLAAEDLKLDDASSEAGSFAVDLDGVPRALIFRAAFKRDGPPTAPVLDLSPALRVSAGATAIPGERFPVRVETDNAPADSRLEVQLGHAGLGGFEPDRAPQVYAGGRRRRVGFAVREGSLAFTASLTDWPVTVDTEGLAGRRLIRVRLLHGDGREIDEKTIGVAFDRSRPELVRILNAPDVAKPGAALDLKATSRATVSGTKSVAFFIGRPQADGKLPPGAEPVAARPVPDDPLAWSARVPMPDKKGPVDVTVVFTNAVGLAATDTATLVLTDAPPVGPARLTGRVTERGVPQPGLAVQLADEKGLKRGDAITDGVGRFAFNDLAPGKYRVLSSNPATPSKANEVVDLEADKPVDLELELVFGK